MTINASNKVKNKMQAAAIFCLLMLPVCPLVLNAQEFSYDGKRWFEVELSVFTNEYVSSDYAEKPVAENLSLQYLPKLQNLLTPISSLMIDFPEPDAPILLPEAAAVAVPQIEDLPEMGPIYSPALPDGFKVNDYARDAFIALTGRLATFNSINRNLNGSSIHRVLWHQVWRQPIQARAQTPAIFVVGGDRIGTHAELEGSLRLSDIGGKAMLDINLWLNRFGIAASNGESEWKVPDLPLPFEETADSALIAADSALIVTDTRTITEVWQMQQAHELGPNALYYFDHPAFGVLIQLRPYSLPEQPVVTDEGDF